jgi:hypothetical protein
VIHAEQQARAARAQAAPMAGDAHERLAALSRHRCLRLPN